MGILFRSAIVIGVLVYLSPFRSGPPAERPTSGQTSAASPLPGTPLSASADTVWQSLPENARKAIADEAKRQVLNEIRGGGLLPNGADTAAGADLPHHTNKETSKTTNKR